ncbi:hypothetical protein GOP47_0024685 [Adiantum capillus-veneris]|uniref:2Fe-2S ferredoxin-type domain-containing protein n=1 Tax=Adiantum capillus-veneris TaxID=13818 RepID=A0A9D4Z3V5_ADICA|nr:hypothetical protein GOP47_0024685 [Adiantum capillus-veneris]
MAPSALGLPSATRFAEGVHASSSSAFWPEPRKGFLRVTSCPGRSALISVRSSFKSSTGVAEPSLPSTEASQGPSSSTYSASSAEPTVDAGPPTIDLEFLGLEQGEDGLPKADTISVGSGEKLLRTVMNEQKLELYDLYGKIMNCGGGGSCGTCIVEVLEGSELLNERTDAEERYLKKKPGTWRLSCQTIVGDKTNSGKVVVQRLPQKKK